MRPWHTRSAWVIGASSGIGASVARELLSRGCRVAISARSEAGLRDVAQERMFVAPVDITESASIHAAATAVQQEFGELDIVIMVSGYWQQMSGQAFDYEVFAKHNDVNVLGLARCIAEVVPVMQRQGRGNFIGVSSVAGYRGMPGSSGYGPSKAGQLNLLESLRCDLRDTGVVVQTVSPGFVKTPMTDVNTFKMPFLIEADEAAKYIVDGIEKEKAEIVFPPKMMIAMKLARLVPQQIWPKLFKPVKP